MESKNIVLCPDGKYRWYYEYPMLKNPVILFTVWKVVLIGSLVPALVQDDGSDDGEIEEMERKLLAEDAEVDADEGEEPIDYTDEDSEEEIVSADNEENQPE